MIKQTVSETMFCASCEREIMSTTGKFTSEDKFRVKNERLLFQYVSDTTKDIFFNIYLNDPTLIGANLDNHGFLCDNCKEKYLLELAERIKQRNRKYKDED